MKYTIKSYKNNIAELEIIFDDKTSFKDKMGNLPVDDKEAMDNFVLEYSKAYLAGKEIENREIKSEIVGKTQELETN